MSCKMLPAFRHLGAKRAEKNVSQLLRPYTESDATINNRFDLNLK